MSDPGSAPSVPSASALTAKLNDLLLGYQRTQIVFVAARLGLADHIAGGPRSVEDLAEATETHAPSLRRLLRALAAHGLFTELGDGSFGLTPLAELLRADAQDSQRGAALTQGEDYYRLWSDLLWSVQTGEPAFERVFGLTNWAYGAENPERNARFNAYMAVLTRWKVRAVCRHYRFPDTGVVVDVGGGDGTLLDGVLRQYPGLRGVLFDQPHVIAEGERRLHEAGLSDRCEIVAGDFFARVPEGGDRYVLSSVLHDWDDERAAAILRQCRRAMSRTARLVVIEMVLPTDDHPSPTTLSDLHMLLATQGGRERTEGEWRALLDAGGFRLASVIPAGRIYHVLEAHPRPDTA